MGNWGEKNPILIEILAEPNLRINFMERKGPMRFVSVMKDTTKKTAENMTMDA